MSRYQKVLASLVLAAALVPLRAHAQLHAWTHDRTSGSAQLALIDAASGVLTPIGAGLSGCCELGNAAVANDPFNQLLYAIGPDPASLTGDLRLLRLALPAGGGSVVGPLGSSERVVGLAFEQSTRRLIAQLAAASGALRLASIDLTTGAATTIHSGLADCCVLEPGVSALANGSFLTLGRLRTDVTGTRVLFALSTTGDNAVSSTPLVAGMSLAALVSDQTSGLIYGVEQRFSVAPRVATVQLVRVLPGTGLTPIGAAINACCAIAVDTAAIEGGALRVLARNPANPGLSVLSFDLTSGAAGFSAAAVPAQRIVDGLFDLRKGLSPSTTTITSIAPPSVVIGQAYTVNVSVTSTGGPPTGSVLVSDGVGGQCAITLPASASACALTATQIGALTITAAYSGTANMLASSDTDSVNILQSPTTTTIQSVVPSPAVVGQSYTVTVAASGYLPTGTISVVDGLGGSCPIVLPATSCVLGSISTGPRTLTASYPGDANNLPSSATAAHMVSAAASTTVISSIVPSPSVVGQAYAVTVAVSGFGVPMGSITVGDGSGASCVIALPASVCMLTSTTVGNQVVTASYGGDSNNLGSTASQAHVVERAASTTSIGAIVPSPGIAGQPYTVNAGVSGYGTPTGTISVSDGSGALCTITPPAGSCALTSSSAGNKTLTASYSGDANNLPSSDTEAQTVNPASTSTSLSASPSPAVAGAAVTLTATIGNGVAPRTGTVAFTANGNPIPGCAAVVVAADSAVCATAFTLVGTRVLVANYSGDANNLGSNGTASLSIERAATTTVLTANPNPVAPGASTLLTATVTGGYNGLTGTVSISANGVPVAGCQALALNAGVAACSASFATPGQITLLASYSGDENDLPSSATAVLEVLLIAIPALGGFGLGLLALLLAGVAWVGLRGR